MTLGPRFYADLAAAIRSGLDSSSAMAQLRVLWWRRYLASTPGALEQHLSHGSASYLFDRAGDLGDSSRQDRSVAAYGFIEKPVAGRELSYQARFPLGSRFEREVDRGHMMPHTAGGLYGPNLFPQLKALNRGWSGAGRTYRGMETRAVDGELFYFCALTYCDDTDMPVYIELGLVEGGVLTVELFRNRFDIVANAAFPPTVDEWLDSFTVQEFGDLGEETARIHLEDELEAVIVALGDSGMERGSNGEQDVDVLAVLDGELTAVEVKTRYLGKLAGKQTRRGDLRRPQLRKPGASHRQGSLPYTAARVDKYAEMDGEPRIVVALVDLQLKLTQLFEVRDGRVLAAEAAPHDCSAALAKVLTPS